MTVQQTTTVWIAYYPDWSGFAVFASEIEALRHACDEHMSLVMIVMPCRDVKKEANRANALAEQNRLMQNTAGVK
jgi:hypothetical protein